MLADVIRSEGMSLPSVLGRPQWPDQIGGFVTGGGGETGRAWYYRTMARCYSRPSVGQILRLWRPGERLHGVDRGSLSAFAARNHGWLARARELGYHGWAALDLVYSEQRFRFWGRSMLPATAFPVVAGFGHPDVQRAMMSLPLESKLADSFHRHFVQARRSELALGAPVTQRAGVPRPVRQMAARLRSRRQRGEALDGLASASALVLRDRILDDILERDSLTVALGDNWRLSVRQGFAAGEPKAVSQALHLASLASADDWLSSVT